MYLYLHLKVKKKIVARYFVHFGCFFCINCHARLIPKYDMDKTVNANPLVARPSFVAFCEELPGSAPRIPTTFTNSQIKVSLGKIVETLADLLPEDPYYSSGFDSLEVSDPKRRKTKTKINAEKITPLTPKIVKDDRHAAATAAGSPGSEGDNGASRLSTSSRIAAAISSVLPFTSPASTDHIGSPSPTLESVTSASSFVPKRDWHLFCRTMIICVEDFYFRKTSFLTDYWSETPTDIDHMKAVNLLHVLLTAGQYELLPKELFNLGEDSSFEVTTTVSSKWFKLEKYPFEVWMKSYLEKMAEAKNQQIIKQQSSIFSGITPSTSDVLQTQSLPPSAMSKLANQLSENSSSFPSKEAENFVGSAIVVSSPEESEKDSESSECDIFTTPLTKALEGAFAPSLEGPVKVGSTATGDFSDSLGSEWEALRTPKEGEVLSTAADRIKARLPAPLPPLGKPSAKSPVPVEGGKAPPRLPPKRTTAALPTSIKPRSALKHITPPSTPLPPPSAGGLNSPLADGVLMTSFVENPLSQSPSMINPYTLDTEELYQQHVLIYTTGTHQQQLQGVFFWEKLNILLTDLWEDIKERLPIALQNAIEKDEMGVRAEDEVAFEKAIRERDSDELLADSQSTRDLSTTFRRRRKMRRSSSGNLLMKSFRSLPTSKKSSPLPIDLMKEMGEFGKKGVAQVSDTSRKVIKFFRFVREVGISLMFEGGAKKKEPDFNPFLPQNAEKRRYTLHDFIVENGGWRSLFKHAVLEDSFYNSVIIAYRSIPKNRLIQRHSWIELQEYENIAVSDIQAILPHRRIHLPHVDWLWFVAQVFFWCLFIQLELTDLAVDESPTTHGGVKTATSYHFLWWLELMLLCIVISRLGVLILSFVKSITKYGKTIEHWLAKKRVGNNDAVVAKQSAIVCLQECKEVLLSYFFLWHKGPMSLFQLQQEIENFLLEEFSETIESDFCFDVVDGVSKLKALKLVEERKVNFKTVFFIVQSPAKWSSEHAVAHLDDISVRKTEI